MDNDDQTDYIDVSTIESDISTVASDDNLSALSSEGETESTETITYEATAYTAGYESTGKHPNDPAYGITASGARVAEGRTIACPPSLPFGTRLNIEGIGERVCEDRGGAITEGRIDIYFEDLGDALNYGRRSVEVTVIE